MKKFVIILAVLMAALPVLCQDNADVEYIYQCWDNGGTKVTLIRIDVDVVGESPLPLFSKWYDAQGVEQSPPLADLTNGVCSNDAPVDQILIRDRCDYNRVTSEGISYYQIISITPTGVETVLGSYTMSGVTYVPVNEIQIEGFCEPDLELLEPECYEVTGGEYCDYSLFFPASSSTGLTRGIDSIFSKETYLELNYPYTLQNAGTTDFAEYTRLHDDLKEYMDNRGYYYLSVGPAINIRQTKFELTRSSTFSTSNLGTTQVPFGNTVSNCITIEQAKIKLYRDQLGEVQLIIDDQGNVLTALPTFAIKQVECDLELLDTECYEVPIDTTVFCNSRVLIPALASNPFDPNLSASIDSIYIDNEFIALPNYPYSFVVTAGNTDELPQLQTDIQAYLSANNMVYQMFTPDLELVQSTSIITRTTYDLVRQNSTASSGQNSTAYSCTQEVETGIYRVYRSTSGTVHIIVDDKGQTLQELPANAVKVECCTVCNIVTENNCQVKNKTKPFVITNEVVTFPADTYHSIAIWHTYGAMQMTIDDNEPVIFLEHRNFVDSDTSPDKCLYKQSTYTIDTTQNGGGQVVVKIAY